MRTWAFGLALLAGCCPAAAMAQAVAVPSPVGTPEGAGPGVGMAAHDRAGELSIADQVEKARREGGSATTAGSRSSAVAAPASDLVIGASVFDKRGKPVGAIRAVSAVGIVVASDKGDVSVPAEAFGKGSKGLMLDLSKSDFDRLVAAALAAPAS